MVYFMEWHSEAVANQTTSAARKCTLMIELWIKRFSSIHYVHTQYKQLLVYGSCVNVDEC